MSNNTQKQQVSRVQNLLWGGGLRARNAASSASCPREAMRGFFLRCRVCLDGEGLGRGMCCESGVLRLCTRPPAVCQSLRSKRPLNTPWPPPPARHVRPSGAGRGAAGPVQLVPAPAQGGAPAARAVRRLPAALSGARVPGHDGHTGQCDPGGTMWRSQGGRACRGGAGG